VLDGETGVVAPLEVEAWAIAVTRLNLDKALWS